MTHSVHTETLTAPRLIDANALNEVIKDFFASTTCSKFSTQEELEQAIAHDVIKLVKSAPTVETTDDVLARLPKEYGNEQIMAYWSYLKEKWAAGYPTTRKMEYAKTPLEALKKLEASINTK